MKHKGQTSVAPAGRGAVPDLRGQRSTDASLRRLATHRAGTGLLERERLAGTGITMEVAARPGRIRHRDRMFFFTQLAIMASAEVPVAAALSGIARQCDRQKLREILHLVLREVESGQPLSSGLARHPKVFPSVAVHLLRAGEASGDLAGMLTRISALLEREYEMGKKLKAALTYPMVMMLLAVGTVISLFTVILPKFRTLYAGKEGALPRPTKILLAAGDFFAVWYPAVIGGIVAIIVGLTLALRTDRGRSTRDSALLAIPVVGGVLRKFSLARSVRALGAMLQSGVPTLSALELARDLSANMRMKEAWEYVRRRVAEGGRIHEGMAGQGWFPGTLVQMTAVGEAGGILDRVLVKVGEFYDREAEVAVQESTALLEPLIVCVVGAAVGFVAMAIMLPIFNMSKVIR